jgi:hypothetical protein
VPDEAAHFLRDLGPLLLEKAQAARARPRDEFVAGQRLAYYDVLTLLTIQAAAFGLPLEALGLRDADLEALL